MLSSCLQDSFRAVTASQDLSLRVLTWRNDRVRGLTLESQYHLLGGSHTMSRYCMLYALVWVQLYQWWSRQHQYLLVMQQPVS